MLEYIGKEHPIEIIDIDKDQIDREKAICFTSCKDCSKLIVYTKIDLTYIPEKMLCPICAPYLYRAKGEGRCR